jgi:hypothetical protein
MAASDWSYSPGLTEERPLPLERFLPPLPPAMFETWLKENITPGNWLIDPFGSNPALALEAARAGYRVLVTSNNPILTFMVETLASAPSAASFQSAIAELAASRRGTERLEVHLQALYESQCPACGRLIQATGFLWKKDEIKPYSRLISCPHCGASGEHPRCRIRPGAAFTPGQRQPAPFKGD